MPKTRHLRKNKKHRTTKKNRKQREHAVIKEFREFIKNNSIERMYLTLMIEQIPKNKKYNAFRLKNIDDMLNKLNKVLTVAPDYNETKLVGTPLSAIIFETMGTPAGLAAFRNYKINAMFKKILKAWTKFLNSPKSRYVLNSGKNGWFSKNALKKINLSDYVHDPNKKYMGFKSWNDFFTRKFVKGARPIAEPDNNKVIVSACDSTIYKISRNVKRMNTFWIKSQPYSLIDIFNGNEKYTNYFEGGDIFQAFLNPFNYHRWHSPITGTIIDAKVIEGLYFSQRNQQTDFGKNQKVLSWIEHSEDPNDQDASEGYITTNQTRALILIKSDDPKIGIVALMPIGMVEISSCVINRKIKKGYHIKKGEEVGKFQFGGSTHCLIFKKGAIKNFTKKSGVCKLGSQIALAN